ncbi:hypothetical protein KIPE111705_36930 [Kibdelosporangium persicum]|uniref:hypothetical protein n=1 Tax=Kibdelosporangium persicum TaxID=2698649 RepID=UPI0015637DC3|nr:hypothetical protein [Kibdelosporangium persicum]
MTTDNARNTSQPETGPGPVADVPPARLPAVRDRVTSPGLTARARLAAAWLGWHGLELAGVGIPLALAVTVDGTWAVPAGVIAAAWATHEIQLTRRHRTPGGGTASPPGNSANTEEPSGKDRDHD